MLLLALLGFAGNSLLCRLALRGGDIDAAGFTVLRIASGALVLWLLDALHRRGAVANLSVATGASPRGRGDWASALALFTYAAAFSYAYLGLS
ncbi:MAG: EamA family transporter, partial [Rubrivivax sp.]